MRKHIKAYQAANAYREGRIEDLRKTIEETAVIIQNVEEEKKDYDLIIKAYQDYVELERKRSDEQYNINPEEIESDENKE